MRYSKKRSTFRKKRSKATLRKSKDKKRRHSRKRKSRKGGGLGNNSNEYKKINLELLENRLDFNTGHIYVGYQVTDDNMVNGGEGVIKNVNYSNNEQLENKIATNMMVPEPIQSNYGNTNKFFMNVIKHFETHVTINMTKIKKGYGKGNNERTFIISCVRPNISDEQLRNPHDMSLMLLYKKVDGRNQYMHKTQQPANKIGMPSINNISDLEGEYKGGIYLDFIRMVSYNIIKGKSDKHQVQIHYYCPFKNIIRTMVLETTDPKQNLNNFVFELCQAVALAKNFAIKNPEVYQNRFEGEKVGKHSKVIFEPINAEIMKMEKLHSID